LKSLQRVMLAAGVSLAQNAAPAGAQELRLGTAAGAYQKANREGFLRDRLVSHGDSGECCDFNPTLLTLDDGVSVFFTLPWPMVHVTPTSAHMVSLICDDEIHTGFGIRGPVGKWPRPA